MKVDIDKMKATVDPETREITAYTMGHLLGILLLNCKQITPKESMQTNELDQAFREMSYKERFFLTREISRMCLQLSTMLAKAAEEAQQIVESEEGDQDAKSN